MKFEENKEFKLHETIVSEAAKGKNADIELIRNSIQELKSSESEGDKIYINESRAIIKEKLDSLKSQHKEVKANSSRHTVFRRLAVVTACILLVFVVIPTVSSLAFNVDIFSISREVIMYLREHGPFSSGNEEYGHSTGTTVYESVEELMEKENISFPVVTWVPDGYKLDTVEKVVYPDQIKYDMIYRCKDKSIIYSVGTIHEYVLPEHMMNTQVGDKMIYVQKNEYPDVGFQWVDESFCYVLYTNYASYEDKVKLFESLEE